MKFVQSRVIVSVGFAATAVLLICAAASNKWIAESIEVVGDLTESSYGLWKRCYRYYDFVKCSTYEDLNEKYEDKNRKLGKYYNIRLVVDPYLIQTRGLLCSAIVLSILSLAFTVLGVVYKHDLIFKRFVLCFLALLITCITKATIIIFMVKHKTIVDGNKQYLKTHNYDLETHKWNYKAGFGFSCIAGIVCAATGIFAYFEKKIILIKKIQFEKMPEKGMEVSVSTSPEEMH